jgi:hypothetical protein
MFVRSTPGDESDALGGAASGRPEPAVDPSASADGATEPSSSGTLPVEKVQLTIQSRTKDISVYLGEDEIGTSAEPIALNRGSEQVELTLKKPGFVPEVVTVTPEDDVVLKITMRRARGTPTARPPASGSTARPPRSGDPAEIYYPPGFGPK